MKITLQIEVSDKVLTDFIEKSEASGTEDKVARAKLMQSIIHRVSVRLGEKLKSQIIRIITKGEKGIVIIKDKNK